MAGPWGGSDLYGFAASFTGCLSLKLAIEFLAERNLVSSITSRKIMHIGAGLAHVLLWAVYSDSRLAPWLAGSVPFMFGLWYIAVTLGLKTDRKLVLSATRNGRQQELLAGALYGLVLGLATLCWRTSPTGIVASAALFAGDGVAELAGRRYGHLLGPLPHNLKKTVAGSLACALATFIASAGLLWLYNFPLRMLQPALSTTLLLRGCTVCSIVAAVVESLPFKDIDNILVPLVVAALAVPAFAA